MRLSKLNNNSLSDEILATCLQQGDQRAFSLLIERHKDTLYRVIWRHVGHEDDAYDLVQETFIRLHDKIAQYNSEYLFKPWLYQIAVNLCRDFLRKKKMRRFFGLENEAIEIIDEAPSAEQHLEHKKKYQQVKSAIEALPFSLKTAFIVFAVEGRSLVESAELLGVTPKTIETRVHRARKILKERFLQQ